MIQDIAPHKYYVDYHPSTPNDTDLVFIYGHHTILCNFEDPQIRYPSIAEIAPVFPEIREKAKFLFRIDETNYYELRRPQLSEFDIWKYENTLILRRAVPGWLGFAGITGYQIHTWYTDHTYCGRCGTKMHAPGNERAMQCPSCGALSYPVICPSVIVAITDGDRLAAHEVCAIPQQPPFLCPRRRLYRSRRDTGTDGAPRGYGGSRIESQKSEIL